MQQVYFRQTKRDTFVFAGERAKSSPEEGDDSLASSMGFSEPFKGWIQWHKDKTKENDASMTDCLQQTAARQGQKKKGEKTRKHNSLSFSAQAEQLVTTQCAGFIYALQRFELFKQVIYSRWRFRAQFTTRTSRTGSCPTQRKHATLLPFFLCWTQKHPSWRCHHLPHWLILMHYLHAQVPFILFDFFCFQSVQRFA